MPLNGAVLASVTLLSFNSETCFPPWTELLLGDRHVLSYLWKDTFAACQSLTASQLITIFSEEENYFAANLAMVFPFLFIFFGYKHTMESRYKESLYNEVLGITNGFICLSNSKLYEKEPRYNEASL